jgi:FkbM family methyltransferase
MYYLAAGSSRSEKPTFMKLDASVGDHVALLFPEKSVAKWFYESDIAEKPLILWAKDNFIKPDKNFIDIGAHVGTYAWSCAASSKHTYAFECNPKVFCYLAANTVLQGLENKITLHQTALGDKEGILDYHIRSEDGGGNGVKKLSDTDDTLPTQQVRVRTLDSFGIRNVGFLKIDVEGFEKEVLMGAQETLKESGYPPFIFESWGEWKNGASAIRKELFEYIESTGYRITPIQGSQDMFLAARI